MNILLLSPWLPWPLLDGARIRIFETLRYLSRRHRVTLLAHIRHSDEVKDISPLQQICERIETTVLSDRPRAVLQRLTPGLLHGVPLIQSFHYDFKLAWRVREITSQESFDIAQIEFPFLARYISAISPQSYAKKVLSMHNIESNRFNRELTFSPWSGRRLVLLADHLFFKSWEKNAIRQFDGITSVSNVDQEWIQNHAPNATVEVVPNGVDTEYFCPVRKLKGSPSIVFTGVMNYPPNVDAAIWFSNKILPELHKKLPNLCFKIVGNKPHPMVLELGKRKGIHVTGKVSDIRPYIAESSAFVVPLRSGGGTRLKILQALAMECPVISTTLGAEGLEVTPGRDILIADEPSQFASQILLVLTSPDIANRLGKAGRDLAVKKYDWKICLEGLEKLYDRLLEKEQFPRSSVISEPAHILER